MTIEIKDGQGSPRCAGVNADNRLLVASIVETLFRHRADEGQAYLVYTQHNSQVADTNENLCYFKNNGLKNVRITRIVVTTDAAIGKFGVYFAPTYTSGGTARIPLNMNRSSANASSVVVYANPNNDLVMSVDSAMEFACSRIGVNTFAIEFDDAVLLGPGKSIGMLCAANATGKAMRATIMYYEEEPV